MMVFPSNNKRVCFLGLFVFQLYCHFPLFFLLLICRFQLEAAAKAKVLAAYSYSGVAATLRRIYLEEGIKGLSRGIGPRLLYSACFSAIGFLSFETCRIALLRHHLESMEKNQVKKTCQWSSQPPFFFLFLGRIWITRFRCFLLQ